MSGGARLAAGWDGGGTKTRVLCLDENGVKLGEASFGALNLNGATVADVRQTVRDATAFTQSLGTCGALVISAAGVSNPDVEASLLDALRSAGYAGPARVVGDQESALYGAVGASGAVLIAGTGSICYGRGADGRTARSGGYGYLVDDEGSGYAIGRDVAAAVLRAGDGRGRPTRLTEALARREGWQDVPSIMRSLYSPGFEKARVAALAPALLEIGDDEAAGEIARKAAGELALLARAVIDRLGLAEGRMAFLGGILTRYPSIRAGVERALRERYPRIQGFEPLEDAAWGAARMAVAMLKEVETYA